MSKTIKLLTISASPTDGSSTDILLHEMSEGIEGNLPDGYKLGETFVKLSDIEIKGCIACGESPEPAWCIFDELNPVYEKLAACDCLLFGSPLFFDSVSAQAKLFIDRCNCFRPPDYKNSDADYPFKKRLTRKRPGAMVQVGGADAWFEGARRVIAGFFKWVEVVNSGMIQYDSEDYHQKGLVASDKATLAEARLIGKNLAKLLVEYEK